LFRFLNLLLENPQRQKLATKMFELSLFCVFTPKQIVRNFFFHIRGEGAFSAVQRTVPVLLDFTFHKTLELRGKKWRICYQWTPRGSANGPVDRSQNRAFCCRPSALYKLFRLLFECSDSTSVFTSYSVIMCNWHGVSSENLVVIQGHWVLDIRFLL
jgi:hypothetical protein